MGNSRFILTFSMALLAMSAAHASLEGVGFTGYKVMDASRPCCNFALSVATDALGISKLTSIDRLGTHRFAHPKNKKNSDEGVGIAFTCHAGFVDIAHVRDNADWTAHLISLLPSNLGTGKSVEVHQEHSAVKSLSFPELDPVLLASLDENDIALIARRIAYQLSIWHEIETGFEVHVSTVFGKETSSSFSIEDVISNLIGTDIGARAALDTEPFETAVTRILKESLEDWNAQDYETAVRAHKLVRGTWWIKRLFPNRTVVKKKFTASYGTLVPVLHPDPEEVGCSKDDVAVKLDVPALTRSGLPLDLFYSFKITPEANLRRHIKRITGMKSPREITPADFTALIHALEKRFSSYL